jgi:hypothetical protein
VGKPKSGKSTAIRSLATCIIKGKAFLGRQVHVPKAGGKVLYIHLDRKDPVENVADELRTLGITEKEAERLHLLSAEDMPDKGRMEWLISEVTRFKPILIIIDLLFQFVSTENANAYNENLKALNELQDALREAGFKGHLLTAHHARKATNPEDVFDDYLGTQAIRGSSSTGIHFKHDKGNKRYTLQSDQTFREPLLGDIEETVVERSPETGEIYLGNTLESLKATQKRDKDRTDGDDVLHYVQQNANCTQADILEGISISKANLNKLLKKLVGTDITRTGDGVANSPFRYTANPDFPLALQLVMNTIPMEVV